MPSAAVRSAAVALLTVATGCAAPPLPGDELPLQRVELPDGFRIEIYTDDVPGARSLTLGDRGTLFVGTRPEGRVYAVVDGDGDGRGERVHVLAEGLESPNGVAFRDGDLYVAEISRILRFADIERRLAEPPEPTVVFDRLPDDRHHGWKFIAFGPDGKLYVPVGAPCNICDEPLPYASIQRLDLQTRELETVSRGVRNTVGFAWQPGSGRLWFTDNGRDWLGDERPPDELNVVQRAGEHFGYPHCHGRDIVDPELGRGRSCADFSPPAQELGPHVAALGMRFYQGEQFPEEYRGDVLIAEHGSWNRSTPIGYRITRVRIEGDRATGYETFADGWLTGREAWGRPVDVQELPDGSLLVSDDRAGAVYRITWEGTAPPADPEPADAG